MQTDVAARPWVPNPGAAKQANLTGRDVVAEDARACVIDEDADALDVISFDDTALFGRSPTVPESDLVVVVGRRRSVDVVEAQVDVAFYVERHRPVAEDNIVVDADYRFTPVG